MTTASETPLRLGDLGERRLLAELIEPRYRADPFFGNDCAAFGDDRVITTDSCSRAMVTQLKPEDQDPADTGWLLATMNLSDLAAAGAEPEGLVVNYTLPRNTPVETLRGIMDGVDECVRWHGTRVLGGDLGEGKYLRLSATAVGRCPPRADEPGAVSSRVGRRGARAGDRLLLLGSPGYLWGAAALRHLDVRLTAEDEATVMTRASRPVAQLVGGRLLARRGWARAATDVSDGLGAAVRNLCRASGVGARVTGMMKLDQVLMEICLQAEIEPFELGQTWGDWCLLVAVANDHAGPADRLLSEAGVEVRDIGVVTAQPEVLLDDGTATPAPWHGVDQERFSETSWSGAGIAAVVRRMRRPGPPTQPPAG